MGVSAAGWTVAMFAWAGVGNAFLRSIVRSPMLPSILMGAATGLVVGAATCVLLTSLPRVARQERAEDPSAPTPP
jgi:hypothetical protein